MLAGELLSFLDTEGPANIPIDDAAEVITIDSQFHSHGKRPWSDKHGGNHETPIIPLAFVPESQKPKGVP